MNAERYYDKALLNLSKDAETRKAQIEGFNRVVEKVEKMMSVDTSNFEEFEITSEIESPLREDEVKESLDRELVFSNTTHREYGYFKLDNILED